MPRVGELDHPGVQIQDEIDERDDLRHQQSADEAVEPADDLGR
jgi:hypothetical protein